MKEIIEQLKRAIEYINSVDTGTTDFGIFLIKGVILDLQRAGWIKVSDRLPENNQRCIIWNSIRNEIQIVNFVNDNNHTGFEVYEKINYWQPLPEEPCKK